MQLSMKTPIRDESENHLLLAYMADLEMVTKVERRYKSTETFAVGSPVQ